MDSATKAGLALALCGGLATPAHATPQYSVTDLGSLIYGEAWDIGANGHVTGSISTPTRQQHAISYSDATGLVDLGTLGGRESLGLDVNASGQITGWADRGIGTVRPFLYSPGTGMTDLGTLGGLLGSGAALNNNGQATGWAQTADFDAHAFLYSQQTGMVDLGTLGGHESAGSAINNAGQVTGRSWTAAGHDHAFLYTPGTGMTDLGALGGLASGGEAINASGQVTGWANRADGSTHAFLYTGGTGMADLGLLNYTEWDVGVDINNRGQVIGRYMLPGYNFGAFMYSPGTGVVDIGHLGGGETDLYALNAAGQAVGWSKVTPWDATHAIIYRDGSLLDLNALIEPTAGWLLAKANDINDRGEIIGMGLFEGSWHAFLLRPGGAFIVPELDAVAGTGALSLLVGALALVGERRRQGSKRAAADGCPRR
ncbi:hypothetical protein [Methylomagnum sp.]